MPLDKFQDKLVSKALDRLEGLTEWECEFIQSIADCDTLTDKQAAVLNRIAKKLEFD